MDSTSTASLSSALQRLDAAKAEYLAGKEGSKDAVLDAARALIAEHDDSGKTVASQEKASDFLQRVMWSESVLAPMLVVVVHLQLFQKLKTAGEKGLHTDELLPKSPYHKKQLERMLRHLYSSRLIGIKSAGLWLSTPLSNELAMPHFQSSMLFSHYITRSVFDGLPEYYQRLADGDASALPVPAEQHRGPFQISLNTDLPFFHWLGANPKTASQFNDFMQAYRAGNTMWFASELYPVQERLVQGFDPAISDVFLIDVGGGKGHELTAFAAAHSKHPGKLILQDQESVLAEVAGQTHPFEMQRIDFFVSQPVQHARAYFMHSIMHDWGDEDCIKILSHLKAAMKPGYSKLLLHDIVLSEEDPTVKATSMDVAMLAHLNPAYERTEGDFRQLLETVGLRIVHVYGCDGAAESVIEAELAA